MAAELVSAVTSEKLTELDWIKSIQICEFVATDHRQAKDVIKAIKKRVGSKSTATQLFSVMLLEMLMNNIGEPIHKQVIDTGLLPVLVKIVKKKSDLPVREKIFLLLDATQTSLGGASGSFPQYYSAYYDLVSAGVQFTQLPPAVPKNYPTLDKNKHNSSNEGHASSGHERHAPQAVSQIVPESSAIEKAGAALEVLREVLDAVDAKHPEGAKDEFTLDLVEQCSFQKQRIMHLVLTSRDEKVVGRAIELNEQLQKVLARHDELIAGRSTSASNKLEHEDVEEQEEAEQLIRRIRKGKACTTAEEDCHLGFHRSAIPGEMVHRPIIRPLSMEPKHEATSIFRPAVVIPPPPAKHVEREKFFQENKADDASALTGHVGDLSLHTRNSTSSASQSLNYSD